MCVLTFSKDLFISSNQPTIIAPKRCRKMKKTRKKTPSTPMPTRLNAIVAPKELFVQGLSLENSSQATFRALAEHEAQSYENFEDFEAKKHAVYNAMWNSCYKALFPQNWASLRSNQASKKHAAGKKNWESNPAQTQLARKQKDIAKAHYKSGLTGAKARLTRHMKIIFMARELAAAEAGAGAPQKEMAAYYAEVENNEPEHGGRNVAE